MDNNTGCVGLISSICAIIGGICAIIYAFVQIFD